MHPQVESIIQQFGLQAHPEGGYFRETYRAGEQIRTGRGMRSAGTAIYYLLEAGDFSAWHRIQSDEILHFYLGGRLRIYILNERGLQESILGPGPEAVFQQVIPAGSWFAMRPEGPEPFTFLGCTVAPGFEFEDFEMGSLETLIQSFPEHAATIRELVHAEP